MPTPTVALLPALYLVQAISALLIPCNNATQFDCGAASDLHRCIPLEWLCDGVGDCENGLDESHCSYLHDCPPGDFICQSGDCVSGKLKCDGVENCPLGDDERNCTLNNGTVLQSHMLTNCPPDKIPCGEGKNCIWRSWVCDGEMDCSDGSDELKCKLSMDNFSVETVTELHKAGNHKSSEHFLMLHIALILNLS